MFKITLKGQTQISINDVSENKTYIAHKPNDDDYYIIVQGNDDFYHIHYLGAPVFTGDRGCNSLKNTISCLIKNGWEVLQFTDLLEFCKHYVGQKY